MRRVARSSCLVFALATAGCRVAMDVPADFLRVDGPRDEVKATTPDDARLWVRAFADPDAGDVDFWIETLGHDLAARGYVPRDAAAEIRDGDGRVGRVATFDVELDGAPHGYLVAVFTLPGLVRNQVRVVEFVAPAARFAALDAAVRASIATLDG